MSITTDPSMKLPFSEKIGYACGDMASNLYWRFFDLFMLYFYTDVFGIPAAVAGALLVVTRTIDAFSDPAIGAMADRTKTRFGKFRPYLLWGILPITSAGVLLVTVPNLSEGGKIFWAYGTYIFMMLSYSFINIPYGALLGVVTSNSQQRTILTSFRFIGAFTGGIIVSKYMLQLVEFFGHGDQKLGWQLAMVFFGVIAGLLFFTSFLTTKERVEAPSEQSSPLQDIKDLMDNRPWVILFSLALIVMITITLRASSGIYYIKYYVGRPDLIESFNTAYLISLLVGAVITPWLTKYIDKKKLLFILMSIVCVLSLLFFFVPKDQITLIFALHIGIGLALGPKSPLVFSMYADTADYTEWKTGRRATAMTFAAATFSQKLGGALAGGGAGWLLGYFGYVAGQVQTGASETAIVSLLTILPSVFALLSVVAVYFYHLDEKQVAQIQLDLAERKKIQITPA
jgi:GPH family glycoside/pentoside/hexuronide:cation symporter